jgi:hypothetical protein
MGKIAVTALSGQAECRVHADAFVGGGRFPSEFSSAERWRCILHRVQFPSREACVKGQWMRKRGGGDRPNEYDYRVKDVVFKVGGVGREVCRDGGSRAPILKK